MRAFASGCGFVGLFGLVGLFGVACASGSPARTANDAARTGDECASVTSGVSADVTERLERSSNVLDYENIWREAHPALAVGTISGAEVRARIRSHAPEIHRCYASALDRLPEGRGRVVVRFVVDQGGSVPAVSITSSDFQDRVVGCCVAKHVAAWRFPEPTGGGFVVVEYPFVVRMARE